MKAPRVVPPGYQEVLYWRITQLPPRLLLRLNLLAFPLAGLAFAVIFGAAWAAGTAAGQANGWALLAAVLLVLPLHELVHGLTMRAFGVRPQFGVMLHLGALYATAPGQAFTRNQFLAVALAPLGLISALALLGSLALGGAGWAWLLATAAAVNAGGAIGDVWMSGILRRYPPQAMVVDERDGMRIFLPGSPSAH